MNYFHYKTKTSCTFEYFDSTTPFTKYFRKCNCNNREKKSEYFRLLSKYISWHAGALFESQIFSIFEWFSKENKHSCILSCFDSTTRITQDSKNASSWLEIKNRSLCCPKISHLMQGLWQLHIEIFPFHNFVQKHNLFTCMDSRTSRVPPAAPNRLIHQVIIWFYDEVWSMPRMIQPFCWLMKRVVKSKSQ